MNIPKKIAVLVTFDGQVMRDVTNPSIVLLHQASFVAVKNEDGKTYRVFKDRGAAERRQCMTAAEVVERVVFFVTHSLPTYLGLGAL